MKAHFEKLIVAVLYLFASEAHTQNHIPPTEYLPAYPGSWWKYIDDKGETSFDSVESIYRYESYQPDRRCPDYGKYAFVPVLHSEFLSGSVYGSSNYLGPSNAACGMVPFLDTTLGKKWYYQFETRGCFANPGYCRERKVLSVDTALEVNGKTYDSLLLISSIETQSSSPEKRETVYFFPGRESDWYPASAWIISVPSLEPDLWLIS